MKHTNYTDIIVSKEETICLRVINKINISLSPKVNLQDNTAKDYLISKQPMHHAQHRYLTRGTVIRAVNSIKMEQLQIIDPKSVTYKYIPNILEPPSQLKYNDLIKGLDKEV